MLLVIGTIRVAPEDVARVRPVMDELVAATRAEDGCIEYSCAEDLLDPGLLHVKEIWRDKAALDAHFTAPHIAKAGAAMGSLNVQGRELRMCEVEGLTSF
jgi:quinol monooxygenase YgiN